ncbi:DUF2752 domain-containing protein [Hymenobacter guriensis]|uniref:DUF2752 domain-containing protein n=1 Tax=Hymenobacter guriensis TaxID=2793065 RepID=A0ABS0L5G3_9BACT|nr:DUF2752 domain-containing protein [Hymenobacter guriensis]MBG8555165.1 DUF2752 domain-containing protein [Hymenobacter guriensis]
MPFTSRSRASVLSLGILAGLALALLYFRLDPAHYPFPRCPVNWLTGWYCPGCGTQRALHALLHGQLVRAAGLNLLAVACVPLLLLGGLLEVQAFLRPQSRHVSWLYQPWLGWTVVGSTLLFTALRNTPTPLGSWLAP